MPASVRSMRKPRNWRDRCAFGRGRTSSGSSFRTRLPRIFSGARIAINFAVVGAVVGEFVGSDQGLGNLVILAARLLNSPLMFSAIIMLMGNGRVVLLFGRDDRALDDSLARQLSPRARRLTAVPQRCRMREQHHEMLTRIRDDRKQHRGSERAASRSSRFAGCSTDLTREAAKSSPHSTPSTWRSTRANSSPLSASAAAARRR